MISNYYHSLLERLLIGCHWIPCVCNYLDRRKLNTDISQVPRLEN